MSSEQVRYLLRIHKGEECTEENCAFVKELDKKVKTWNDARKASRKAGVAVTEHGPIISGLGSIAFAVQGRSTVSGLFLLLAYGQILHAQLRERKAAKL